MRKGKNFHIKGMLFVILGYVLKGQGEDWYFVCFIVAIIFLLGSIFGVDDERECQP